MAIVFQPPHFKKTTGEDIGRSMGTGLGQGLQLLLQDKMNKMTQRRQQDQTTSGLQSLGIPQQQAGQIAMLPKELQSLVVKNYLAGAESAGLEQALSGLGGIGEAPRTDAQVLQEVGAMQPVASPQVLSDIAAKNPERMSEVALPAQTPKATHFEEVLKRPRLKPEHRLRIEQMAQKERLAKKRLTAQERKDLRLEEREARKEAKPFIDTVNKKVRAAHEDERRLKRMEKLVNKGNLTRPRFHALLKMVSDGIFGFGINLHSLETADSQEFHKLTNEFLRGAKEIFGARITNFEAQAFLKMVPTLAQTDEGKRRVIHNMRLYSEGNEIKKKAMDQVVQEHGGKIPLNFEMMVEERAKPALDALSEEFKKGLRADVKETKEKGGFLKIVSDPIGSVLDTFLGRG